jgi:FkbM family methyltransferase
MEGNECYKLTTVRNYLDVTGAAPIRLAVDVGCNVGDITALLRFRFPQALVFAFEPVQEYFRLARRRMNGDSYVHVFPAAVCGLHRFEDDLGTVPRPTAAQMRIAKALEGSGPGWRGGSMILTEDAGAPDLGRYSAPTTSVHSLTLDDVLNAIELLTGHDQIDYLKMDCEGCECDALGCASREALQRIRFIGGEYHDADRFYQVISKRLYQTHYVNLVGDRWGSFFCERIGEARTILSPERVKKELRATISDSPIDWNPFREEFVLAHEWWSHGL